MLVKSSEDIEAIRNMSKHELVKYAEIKSKEILSLIKESCEKVADAKRDAEDAEAMKERIIEIFKDDEKRQKVGKTASETIPITFETMVDLTLERYQYLVDNYSKKSK